MGMHEREVDEVDEVAEDNGRRMLEACERAGDAAPAAKRSDLRRRLERGSRSRMPSDR